MLCDRVIDLDFRKATDRIVKLALGSNWRQAKFAARYLAFSKNRAELCADIVEVSVTPCTSTLNLFTILECTLRQYPLA